MNNIQWLDIPIDERIEILTTLGKGTKLPPQLIEKDWWVTMVLRVLFVSSFADNIAFKGGTSLSKCWKVIERFSEDVDIAIDREFLGFGGELSKTQISDRLRRKSCAFVREEMTKEIAGQLTKLGIDKSHFSVEVNITSVTTTDPETIRIVYQSVLPELKYIQSSVLIEVGARSMIEPTEKVMVQSIIAEKLPSAEFIDQGFTLRVVTPKRTFLEKAFLLHEEFAKPSDDIRIERMSRHLYDLERLMDTSFAKDAMEDTELYNAIVEHRRKFIGLKGFEYDTLYPQTISFVPPDNVIDSWRADYETMCTTMIHGVFLSYDDLINRVKELNQRFRSINLSSKKA